MRSKDFFLWPNYSPLKSFFKIIYSKKTSYIENMLGELFPSGYPVLCSSGRSGIGLALEFLNLKRNDFLGVFPFASHCVLDAISRYTTPLTGKDCRNVNNRIVYHQWGYVQEFNLPKGTIEDCVDTLCIPGARLFLSGGSFEIWSFPKILGTSSGAVLWCKDGEAAKQIRENRDNRKFFPLLQWLLKLLSNYFPIFLGYWQGIEAINGRLSFLQTGELFYNIRNWNRFVEDKLKKIELTKVLLPPWLHLSVDRLPSIIPVELMIDQKKMNEWGITTGIRNFIHEHENGQEYIQVLPLPIHIDVPCNLLKKIVNEITLIKAGAKNEN
ncbi:putative PLP-dependent aminotransferase [Leptospira noguchii]|nr:putative PLP-dependent aminotransferase [Leptospira noguchii]UOG47550.1 putative PLP-dependent aminotransferase [Leptospira noguchii]